MLMIARLFTSVGPANKAAEALISAGYDDVVVLPAKAAASDGDDGASTVTVDTATAVRAGRMLGEHADFYLSRLTRKRALVVAMPPFLDSRRAEAILDSHDPLPDSHLPPSKPYVPLSERPAPFSSLFGMPVLTKSDTPFSDALGFGFKEEGLSHLSRWFAPLAPGYTFSSKIGMGFKPSKDTFFSASTRSDRLEGRDSSFGMGFKASTETPFSTMLGLPLLSKRKHYLTAE